MHFDFPNDLSRLTVDPGAVRSLRIPIGFLRKFKLFQSGIL